MPHEIKQVAIKTPEGLWALPRPYRHEHILRMMAYLDPEYDPYNELTQDSYGFLLGNGSFVNRWEANDIAVRTQQITEKTGPILTSNMLW